MLRKQTTKAIGGIKLNLKMRSEESKSGITVSSSTPDAKEAKKNGSFWKWGLNKFILSGVVAYVDGRLCRHIPHPIARRIVSGFLISFLDNNSDNSSNKNNRD